MGIVIGIVSAILILSAIYLRVGDKENKLSKALFIIGMVGAIAFALIFTMAIYD